MANVNFKSAGVSAQEIDKTFPVAVQPTGIPAGIIGTAVKGPAFVPVTLATLSDFDAMFGRDDDEDKPGQFAVVEWLRNASAVTYLRVLGVGDGKQRDATTQEVTNAGFTVGQQLPQRHSNLNGANGRNEFANESGDLGRTYFLGAYMSESNGSTYLSDAGLTYAGADTDAGHPIIRGVLMAPSGVIMRLSSSYNSGSYAGTHTIAGVPAANSLGNGSATIGSETLTNADQLSGAITGSILAGTQTATILLNGLIGTATNPNEIQFSFDPDEQHYISKVLNTDPLKIEEKGHYLHSWYDIHPSTAVVTGSGYLDHDEGEDHRDNENCVFLTTGSIARDTSSAAQPNFEGFNDRFTTPKTPWFASQKFGVTKYNLFRLHSRDDGAHANDKFKISIKALTPSADLNDPYGTFIVEIRDFNSLDTDPGRPLSSHLVDLNPMSDRYIAKVIGDQRVFYDFDKPEGKQKLILEGSYANRDRYVRVEVSSDITDENVPKNALPVGFRGPDFLVTSGSLAVESDLIHTQTDAKTLLHAVQPPLPLRKNLKVSTAPTSNTDLYWGIQFDLSNNVSLLNKSKKINNTIKSYTQYFPNFRTSDFNAMTGSTHGLANNSTHGILDSDRFHYNGFSLENIELTYDTSADVATTAPVDSVHDGLSSWQYIRSGSFVSIPTRVGDRLRGFDPAKDLDSQTLRNLFKFTTIMQGGFNGVNVFDRDSSRLNNLSARDEIQNTNRGLEKGSTIASHRKAISIMENTADVDIKLLAIPGIREASITDEAIEAVKNRFDALYIMDIDNYDQQNTLLTSSLQRHSVGNTVTKFKTRKLDTSFSTCYYPDIMYDAGDGTGEKELPASVGALSAYSLNDRIGFEWFAPAGLTRGTIDNATLPIVNLSKKNQDDLYEADVNPIVKMPGRKVFINGQKTLQVKNSSLDRVNVRRLLIYIRRQVREIANSFLFEPNRVSTLERFSAAVEPVLSTVQSQSGLERYQVRIDTTTTTQADVLNNTIRGKIFVQPTRTAEFISLDFEIQNPGTI